MFIKLGTLTVYSLYSIGELHFRGRCIFSREKRIVLWIFSQFRDNLYYPIFSKKCICTCLCMFLLMIVYRILEGIERTLRRQELLPCFSKYHLYQLACLGKIFWRILSKCFSFLLIFHWVDLCFKKVKNLYFTA
jgi:hypothetical protein